MKNWQLDYFKSKESAESTQIFISYSHNDTNLVEPVVRLLRVTDDLVFLDTDSIKPGKIWRQQIEAAIQAAELVVVFWCSHSKASEWVEKEYLMAIQADKDVLPILLDATPVPDNLSAYQWIDFQAMAGTSHTAVSIDQLVTRESEPAGCLGSILRYLRPQIEKQLSQPIPMLGPSLPDDDTNTEMATQIRTEILRRVTPQ